MESPFEKLCWEDLLARNYQVIWGDKIVRATLRQRSSVPYPNTDPCCDFFGRHRFARSHYILAEAKEGEDFDHALVQLGTAARHLRTLIARTEKIKLVIYVEKTKKMPGNYQLRPVRQDHGWEAGNHNVLQSVTAGGIGQKLQVSDALPSWIEKPEGGLSQTHCIQDARVEVIYGADLRRATPAQEDHALKEIPPLGHARIFDF